MTKRIQWSILIIQAVISFGAYSFEPMICTEITTTYNNKRIDVRLRPDEIVMGRKHPSHSGWFEIQYRGRLLQADGRHLFLVRDLLATYADKASKTQNPRRKEKYAKQYNELLARSLKLSDSLPIIGPPYDDHWGRVVDPVHALEKDLDYDRLKEVLKQEQLNALETDEKVTHLENELWKQEVKPEIKDRMEKLSRSKDALFSYDPPVEDPYRDLEHDPNKSRPGYTRSFDTDRLQITPPPILDKKSTHDWGSILHGAWVWHHIDTRWKTPARFSGRWLELEGNNFKYGAEMDDEILVLRNPPLRDGRPGSIVFRMHYDPRRMTFSGVHLNGRFAGHSVVLTKKQK